MSLQPQHPDDLEVMAEDYAEMELLQKMDATTEFDDLVDHLEKDPMKLILFKEDGDYGWSTFAGVFDCLERAVSFASKDGREVVVADSDEGVIPNSRHIDFILVDVQDTTPVELFGVMLVPENAFVNL